MNVVATSIDHHRADVSQRELFACSPEKVEEIYDLTKATPAVSGAVIIDTCNRTELYLSLESERESVRGQAESIAVDPYSLLCSVLDIDEEAYRHLQVTLRNEEALKHLCLLTAGAQSQLWGDSQIITQVGEAVAFAREKGATDGVLNTMFRLGITAGKEIRTQVDLHIHDASTAGMAAGKLLEKPEIQSALVIGNGAIGRMVAERLAKAGIETEMTLRKYKHSQVDIPAGVTPVPYADRYLAMERADAVVSATSSPHVVVTREELDSVESLPLIMIDMAVPRDIEETVGEIEGLSCYNIDEISRGYHVKLKEDQLDRLNEYIEEQVEEFHRWERSRKKVENKIERLTADDRDPAERSHFPLFIDSLDLIAVVIGGGNIAERRVMTMAEFGFDITIVSEDLTETLERMSSGGAVKWIRGRYDPAEGTGETGQTDPTEGGCETAEPRKPDIDKLIDEAWMVLACTNDRDTNREIGRICRAKNKLVNVCDARNESTFWFPAVALNDELTVGLVGKGTDHMNVKKAAATLRSVVENKRYK